jgi:hypothetical protein
MSEAESPIKKSTGSPEVDGTEVEFYEAQAAKHRDNPQLSAQESAQAGVLKTAVLAESEFKLIPPADYEIRLAELTAQKESTQGELITLEKKLEDSTVGQDQESAARHEDLLRQYQRLHMLTSKLAQAIHRHNK